jgi:hypothetical protein
VTLFPYTTLFRSVKVTPESKTYVVISVKSGSTELCKKFRTQYVGAYSSLEGACVDLAKYKVKYDRDQYAKEYR